MNSRTPERILVAEDDVEMARLLAEGLAAGGYGVDTASSGTDALILAATIPFAAAVLDIMMPGMSGFELCRRLRETQPALPILLLTARDAVDDRVRGLDAGADDYLVKPFEFSELHARLRAIRRRESLISVQILQVGNLVIDQHSHAVRIIDAVVSLSPKEFALLRYLAQNAGKTLTREQILTEVWGSVNHTDANVVDQYLSYLRRKIDPQRSGAEIVTLRGVGVRMSELATGR